MRTAGRALPEGRYGKRPTRRPGWTRPLIVAAALLFGGSVAYVAYLNWGSAPVSGERIGYESLPDNKVRLIFDVTRAEPEKPVVCVVRARSLDGAETGRREVYVAPAGSSTRVEAVITGAAEPVTADVFGCSYQVPEYLSTTERPSE